MRANCTSAGSVACYDVVRHRLVCLRERGDFFGTVIELRTIDTLRPSPMPPWVASRALPEATRRKPGRALLAMHSDPAGAEILSAIGIAAFVAVRDRTYDPIRRVAESSVGISL